MISNSNINSNDQERTNYNVKVLKITSVSDDKKKIRFNAQVNGVYIYGMSYIEYVTKEGKPGSMIAFPSYKANNDKFYNVVWIPISRELQNDIEKQISDLMQDNG